jgi:hypothetical protein
MSPYKSGKKFTNSLNSSSALQLVKVFDIFDFGILTSITITKDKKAGLQIRYLYTGTVQYYQLSWKMYLLYKGRRKPIAKTKASISSFTHASLREMPADLPASYLFITHHLEAIMTIP